jgi:hypothetical protein
MFALIIACRDATEDAVMLSMAAAVMIFIAVFVAGDTVDKYIELFF